MTDTPNHQPFAAKPPFRTFRPKAPSAALGLAVSFLMTRPAFANLRFGEWSRILVGQINRRHYAFVLDGKKQVAGFFGWALTTRALAELWVEGRHDLTYEESLAGECLLCNAWCASSTAAHRFMVDEARKMFHDKETFYFKRHYPDGRTRAVRLNVNAFVPNHLSRILKE